MGRAGRDGKPAECILYYSYADRKRLEHFIVSNTDNTLGRKNENLHALYKIIEFCEEPYLCRRKVLLNYLAEDFKAGQCKQRCDNCLKQLRVAEVDFTEQARAIVYLIEAAQKKRMDMTVLQICKFLQGKKQGINNQSKCTKMEEIAKAFFGRLSDLSEEHIKRLIMKLLIQKVVKEKFNSFKVEQTILVYLIPGRRLQAFKEGSVRIVITDVVDEEELKLENQLKKCERKFISDLKKKHATGVIKPSSQTEASPVEQVQPVELDTRPLTERMMS